MDVSQDEGRGEHDECDMRKTDDGRFANFESRNDSFDPSTINHDNTH
jgi:hypothetical protein